MSFRLVVPARARSVRRVRNELLRWLAGADWPRDEQDGLVFAVSEAVSNAVEHAYPEAHPRAVVVVEAREVVREAQRQILASVADRGEWRPAPDRDEGRRRGLAMMRAFTERVVVHHREGGTTVTIASEPVPTRPDHPGGPGRSSPPG